MSVTLVLHCNGCDETAEGTGPLRQRFHSIQHGIDGHGWGAWKLDDPVELAPEGWVMFDPYTKVTYCPACWERIEVGPSDDEIYNGHGMEGGIPYSAIQADPSSSQGLD